MKLRSVIVVCCISIALLFGGCKSKSEEAVFEENTDSGMRRTTLYYATEDGYIVPVMKKIPWEEGIGKAALRYLVSGRDNDSSASMMGLKTVIPEGTEYTLRINDGKVATVDLIGYTGHESASEEALMVTAVVNTLSEFESIDAVRFTLDGKQCKTLAHGTDISKEMEPFALNTEDGELPVSGTANRLTLYFPNISASLNIPVTRYVDKVPSFSVAVQELLKGSTQKGLLNCFPEGTELMSAYIHNGIASVEFTEEFAQITEADGKLEAARDSVFLCANEFEEVYGVDIYVEGNEFSLHTEAVSVPIYVNEFR